MNDQVSLWIQQTKQGDEAAMNHLVAHYYERVMRLALQRVPASLRRVGDEEDIALSVLDSFLARAQRGEFPELNHREDLWRLLVCMSVRKVTGYVTQERAQKRGGGQVRGNSVFENRDRPDEGGLHEVAADQRTPSQEVEVNECAQAILDFLEQLEDPTLRKIALWKSESISNFEISQRLECSERTVERKLRRLRDKAASWFDHDLPPES